MAKWVQFHLNQGRKSLNAEHLLPDWVLNQIYIPNMYSGGGWYKPRYPVSSIRLYYAMGWRALSYRGESFFQSCMHRFVHPYCQDVSRGNVISQFRNTGGSRLEFHETSILSLATGCMTRRPGLGLEIVPSQKVKTTPSQGGI